MSVQTLQHLSAVDRSIAAGIGTLLSQVAKVSQGPSLHLSGYRVMKLTKILQKDIIGQVWASA
jgi:hypothetical protein